MPNKIIGLTDLPRHLLKALRERGHSDDEIVSMTGERMFKEYCEWHGLRGYGPGLWDLAHTIAELKGGRNA